MSNRSRSTWFALLLIAFVMAFAVPGSAAGKVHEVARGQSLWAIAKRYNVSVDAIREANGLTPGNPIRPGQKLLVKPASTQ